MDSWEPIDIDHDEIADKDVKWDDDVMKDFEIRFNKLREFNEILDYSTDEDLIDMTAKTKYALKHDTIELVANQIYDKLITIFNNDRKRFGIQKGEPVLNPIRKYDNFKLTDDGKISCVNKIMVINSCRLWHGSRVVILKIEKSQ